MNRQTLLQLISSACLLLLCQPVLAENFPSSRYLVNDKVTNSDTYQRQSGIDVLHYTFSIIVNDINDEILGEAIVELEFQENGINELFLDLTSISEKRNGKGMSVIEVDSDEVILRFRHHGNRLYIELDKAPLKHQKKKIRVSYRGVPADGLLIAENRYGEKTFFSRNWPDKARQWLPIIDHPSDKATSEFMVIAPSKYQVVSNGLLREETDLENGLRLTHWQQSVPIASWLNALGIARFTSRTFGTVKGIPLQTWVYPQDRDRGMATFEIPVRQSIEFFGNKIGPYPYEKLANIEVPQGGGMEHASAIFYGESAVTMYPASRLVAHEIAHQWFGNSVTENDWDDVWLSEGFATYFALLYMDHYLGKDSLVEGLQVDRQSILAVDKNNPGQTVIHKDIRDLSTIFNGLQYTKGSWVLHMLRGELGTEIFWDGIRLYYERFRDQNASSSDLREAMEEVSATDLEWFFEQWLRRPGSPAVLGNWEYNEKTKILTLQIIQRQEDAPFRFPLEVKIVGPKGKIDVLRRIDVRKKTESFEMFVDFLPQQVIFDPNTWLLGSTEVTAKRTP